MHRSPTRRRLAILALALLAVSWILPAAALADAPTPQDMVAAVAASLEDGKAAKELAKALDPAWWDETGHPVWKDGKKAFDKGEKAAKEMQKAGLDATALANAFRAAAGDTAASAKASAELAKGDAALAAGDAKKAIDRYRKAWERAHKETAKKAEKQSKAKASGNGNGSFGNSHTYTFTFVNAAGEMLVVSGSSNSNEGYLFHPAFGPDDTYLDAGARAAVIAQAASLGVPLPDGLDPALGGVMQVHVSCSDAFPGGLGAKSDPAPTSGWFVKTAAIDKGSKNCVLEMDPPTPGDDPIQIG